MKQLFYALHSKWSLFMALPRLWFFENTLWQSFPRHWQYALKLPCVDYITFFPYIVNKKTVKDPINIAAYGISAKKFIALLAKANPKWEQFLGSSYFLYGPLNCGWRASVAIKSDINAESKERHHIRLFELRTAHGKKVTLCAAHRDKPYHTEQEAPVSWDETRDLVATDLAASNLGTLCGLS
ncbi:MAG: hypothetical protein WAP23_03890, partial [Candidatus Spechtbacterales bacterium]